LLNIKEYWGNWLIFASNTLNSKDAKVTKSNVKQKQKYIMESWNKIIVESKYKICWL
jgi:hypothetical protein